jgi:hypothetical protein
MKIDTQISPTNRTTYLEILIVRREFETGERKSNSSGNSSRKTKHALPVKEEDVAKNLMTRRKIMLHLRMTSYSLLKCGATLPHSAMCITCIK